ncbi:endomembrane protein 70, putative [Bodo saltans]|uniref:Transmembrane 9 superfamily member n=1 Tax=Bodo saltans TaxID=75058 RepID=A0A0S4JDZ1_BODSA|nr:endomembrane protein 70, putative [Bodo saltans]|eukprot:CUG88333.1 endomembrane protein 70, putative [Bodo saltans]
MTNMGITNVYPIEFEYNQGKRQKRKGDLRLTRIGLETMQSVNSHYLAALVMFVLANAEPEPMVEPADSDDGTDAIGVGAIFALIAFILLVLAPVWDHLQMRRKFPTKPQQQEKSGWKYLHADVFRPPCNAALLAALVGSGAQLTAMICGTSVVFLEFLRSHFAFLSICNVLCASFVGGYTCGHLLKYFNVQNWHHVCVCAFWFPCTIAVFFFVSCFTRSTPQTDELTLEGIITFLLLLWLLIVVPTIFGGAFLAFRDQPLANPISIGKIAGSIPAQPYYLRSSFLIFVCAFPPLLPILFLRSSPWQGLFDVPLCIVFVVWVIIVALTSVIMVYYMLCYENHQWWWTAFAAPGGLGAPLFAYAAVSYNDPQTDFIYLGLALVVYVLAAGSIGVLSALLFVHKLYSSATLVGEKAELDDTCCLLDRNVVGK